jgi:hypothetical protein
MPENKTLTFPPKSEWPTLTNADWTSNRCHAFLKVKRLLLSMFTALDFVVGNDNYGGEWALIYDTAAYQVLVICKMGTVEGYPTEKI